MIENLIQRFYYCEDRVHWIESDFEREELNNEIKILQTIICAWEWENPKKGTTCEQ